MYRNRDRLIIFDVDGTLIDSFCAIEQASNCMAWILAICSASRSGANY